MAAKIASRAHVMDQKKAKQDFPRGNVGGVARWYGVLPRYMAAAYYTPRNMRKGRVQ